MPTPEPTQIELREARTWRVITLCCESSEPDWHSAGQTVSGGYVMVQLQGTNDGRCGWTIPGWQPTSKTLARWWAEVDAGDTPRMELDGLSLVVRPLAGPWYGPDDADSWQGMLPERTQAGDHVFVVSVRHCSWSGAIHIGAGRPAPAPPRPVVTDGGRWIEAPGYGLALWWCGGVEDVTADSRVRVPPASNTSCDWAAYEQPDDPDAGKNVICALDASGNSHGAWQILYTELPRDVEDRWVRPAYQVDLVPTTYAPCDALRAPVRR